MPSALERALRHHRRGDLRRAETIYRRLLRKDPDAPDPLHLLGCIELGKRNHEAAIRLMKRAVALSPTTALYHENLAEAYHRDGNADLAEAECHLALRLDSRSFRSMNRLGMLALEAGYLETARDRFAESLRTNPTYAEGLLNLSAALNRLGEFEAARRACEALLGGDKGGAAAWNNLGMALKGLGRIAEAKEAFRRAGDFPLARVNLGYVHLLEDDLAAGLALYEERLGLADPGRRLGIPCWDGKPQPGARLLVVHEQGLGDTILMSRFFPRLIDRFAEVTVAVQGPLLRLLQPLHPRLRVVAEAEAAGADLYCPTMSLPRLLGIDAAGKIPTAPWIPAARRERGRGPLRAGINWAGNPSFRYDRIRSTTLDTVAPLLEAPGIAWISLHKGAREAEADRRGLPRPLDGARDFADTAEILSGLDLVVSTETAVPNLAGAMGIPVVLLAAVDHDWRWRSWYREVTVCAQDRPGDWASSVAKARAAVEAFAGGAGLRAA